MATRTGRAGKPANPSGPQRSAGPERHGILRGSLRPRAARSAVGRGEKSVSAMVSRRRRHRPRVTPKPREMMAPLTLEACASFGVTDRKMAASKTAPQLTAAASRARQDGRHPPPQRRQTMDEAADDAENPGSGIAPARRFPAPHGVLEQRQLGGFGIVARHNHGAGRRRDGRISATSGAGSR